MSEPRLTAADVHNVCFSTPPMGRRGYNEDEVDAFLDALETKFRDPGNAQLAWLTPAAVAGAGFGRPPMGRRGYNRDEVDLFLELAAAELHLLLAGTPAATPGNADSAPTGAPPNVRTGLSADHILGVAFGKPGFGRRGYNESQVDDYLDALAAKFRDPNDPAVAWLTPDAIGEASFAPSSWGQAGYKIDDVDRFLAHCRDELDKLLREA